MSTIMTRSAAEFWWQIKVPPEIIYYYRDYSHEAWKTYTWAERFAERKEKQDNSLHRKRVTEEILPCFIWVFYQVHFPFEGWWIYIKTTKHDYGINFRHEHDDDMIEKAMQLFPCGVIPVKQNFEYWAQKFTTQFPHTGFNRKNRQGLAKCYCKIDKYGKLNDLLKKYEK